MTNLEKMFLMNYFNIIKPLPAPDDKITQVTVLATAIAVAAVFTALSIKTLASHGLPEGAGNKIVTGLGALCFGSAVYVSSKLHNYTKLNIQKKE